MKKFKDFRDILLLLLAGLLVIFLSVFIKSPGEKADIRFPDTTSQTLAYGIVIDSMTIVNGWVEKNQNLAGILMELGVNYQKIDSLVKKSKEIFDVRKIRSGNKYSLLFGPDSLLHYFIYEESSTDFIVFDLSDTAHVHRDSKEILRDTVSVAGVIEYSLWQTLVDIPANPNLALDMSEIYAWAIDFYGLQKGDAFRLVYEKLSVEGHEIGVGRIISALFTHAGKDLYAFYFVQDSAGDYFDEEANSLRRTFLKAPLRYSRISSRFSYSRMHPILKYRRPHLGVDYAAPVGTPVQAVGDGVVTKAGRSGGAGKMVKIKHNGTYSTSYLHLSGYGKGIKTGAHVRQGDVIGYVGSTGLSTGAHLDFRFYRNGQAIDPLKVESPPAEPVDSNRLAEYKTLVKTMKHTLDTLK